MFSRTLTEKHFILEIYEISSGISGEPLTVLLVKQRETLEYFAGCRTKVGVSFEYIDIGGRQKLNEDGIFSGAHSFQGSLHYREEGHNIASISSLQAEGGNIFIRNSDLRGQHIGTFFIDKIIAWLKKEAGDDIFFMKPLRLTTTDYQANNGENGARRNQLYINFGFKIKINDVNCSNSDEVYLSELKNRRTWERNLVEVDLVDYSKGIHIHNKRMALTIKNLQAGKKGYKIALQTALLVIILLTIFI